MMIESHSIELASMKSNLRAFEAVPRAARGSLNIYCFSCSTKPTIPYSHLSPPPSLVAMLSQCLNTMVSEDINTGASHPTNDFSVMHLFQSPTHSRSPSKSSDCSRDIGEYFQNLPEHPGPRVGNDGWIMIAETEHEKQGKAGYFASLCTIIS